MLSSLPCPLQWVPSSDVYSEKEEKVKAFLASGFKKRGLIENLLAALGSMMYERLVRARTWKGTWLSPETTAEFLDHPT